MIVFYYKFVLFFFCLQASSEENGVDIWVIALVSGLAFLALVAILVFFVIRRRY